MLNPSDISGQLSQSTPLPIKPPLMDLSKKDQAEDSLPPEGERIANPNYQYEDHDMTGILTIKLRSLQKDTDFPIYIPSMSIGNAAYSLSNYLIDERKHHEGTSRILLVPYNLNRYHWVGISIFINEYDEVNKVIYMDPLENEALDVPADIISKFDGFYKDKKPDFIRKSYLVQKDSSSCGPLTIENLCLSLKGKSDDDQLKNATEEMVKTIRLDHIKIYHSFDSTFYRRQRYNINGTASVAEQVEWLKKAGRNFTKHEVQRIFNVLGYLIDLKDVEIKNKIIEMLSLRSDEHEVKQHLDRIRGEIFKIIKKGVSDYDKTLLSLFLESMWGISYNDASKMTSFKDVGFFLNHEEIKVIAEKLKDSKDMREIKTLKEKLGKKIEEDEALARKIQNELWNQDLIHQGNPLRVKKFNPSWEPNYFNYFLTLMVKTWRKAGEIDSVFEEIKLDKLKNLLDDAIKKLQDKNNPANPSIIILRLVCNEPVILRVSIEREDNRVCLELFSSAFEGDTENNLRAQKWEKVNEPIKFIDKIAKERYDFLQGLTSSEFLKVGKKFPRIKCYSVLFHLEYSQTLLLYKLFRTLGSEFTPITGSKGIDEKLIEKLHEKFVYQAKHALIKDPSVAKAQQGFAYEEHLIMLLAYLAIKSQSISSKDFKIIAEAEVPEAWNDIVLEWNGELIFFQQKHLSVYSTTVKKDYTSKQLIPELKKKMEKKQRKTMMKKARKVKKMIKRKNKMTLRF